MSADAEATLGRQEMIWEGLYGPPRAKELIAQARERLAADPDTDLGALLAELEPDDDDDDPDEAGMSRPGVG